MEKVARQRMSKAALAILSALLASWIAWSACGTRAPALTPEQEQGRVLYEQYCVQCHGGAKGGKLKDIPPPHNTNGHTWHHPDQQLAQITLDGLPFSVESQKMPAFKDKLTAADVQVILAYIKTWWTEEQREWQAKVTENYREGLRQRGGGQ